MTEIEEARLFRHGKGSVFSWGHPDRMRSHVVSNVAKRQNVAEEKASQLIMHKDFNHAKAAVSKNNLSLTKKSWLMSKGFVAQGSKLPLF